MKNSASISLRPKTISEVIGHNEVKKAITGQIDSGSIPRAFMFSGPPGVGKTTLALIVARMVQGLDYPEDAPIDCTELNSADTNGVDDIRELIASCSYRPFSGNYRVLVLNECQMLTTAAQNVLLSPFEAEDSATVFILTTTDPSKIIQPLQDRCKHFKLKPLSAEVEIAELVGKAADHLGEPVNSERTYSFVAQVVNSNIGSPRQILQAYEKLLSGIPLKDCFANAAHEPFYKDIALTICKGDWNTCRSLLAQVQTADSRALRGIVAGFLRSALVKCDVGPKAAALATCVVGMGSAGGFEDGLSWSATCGLFYKTCIAIAGAK